MSEADTAMSCRLMTRRLSYRRDTSVDSDPRLQVIVGE